MAAVLTLIFVLDILLANGQEYLNSKYRQYSAVLQKEVKIIRRNQLPSAQPHRLPIEQLEPDLAERIFQGVHNPLKRTTIPSMITARSAPPVRIRRALSNIQAVQNLSSDGTESVKAEELNDNNIGIDSLHSIANEITDLNGIILDNNTDTDYDDENDGSEYFSISGDFYTDLRNSSEEGNFIYRSTVEQSNTTGVLHLTTSATYPTLVLVDPEFHFQKLIKNPFLMDSTPTTAVPQYRSLEKVPGTGAEIDWNDASDITDESGEPFQAVRTRHEGTFLKETLGSMKPTVPLSTAVPSTGIPSKAAPSSLASQGMVATTSSGSKTKGASRITKSSTVSPHKIIGGTKLPPSNRISLERYANEPLSDLQRRVAKKLDAENKQHLRKLTGKKARIITQLIRRKMTEYELQLIRDGYFGLDPTRPGRKIFSGETRVWRHPFVDPVAAEQGWRQQSLAVCINCRMNSVFFKLEKQTKQVKARRLPRVRRSKRNVVRLLDAHRSSVARISVVDGDVHRPTSPVTTTENPDFRQVYVDHLGRQSVDRDDIRLKLLPHLVAVHKFSASKKKLQAGPLLTSAFQIIKPVKVWQPESKRSGNDKWLHAGDVAILGQTQFIRIPHNKYLLSRAKEIGATKRPVTRVRFNTPGEGNADQLSGSISAKVAFLGGESVVGGLSIKKERPGEASALKTRTINSGTVNGFLRTSSLPLPSSKTEKEMVYVLRNEVRMAVNKTEQAEIRPNKSRDIVFLDEDTLFYNEKHTVTTQNAKRRQWERTIRIFNDKGTTKIYAATAAPRASSKSLVKHQNLNRHYVPFPDETNSIEQSAPAMDYDASFVDKLSRQSSESSGRKLQHSKRRDVRSILQDTPTIAAWKDTAFRQFPVQGTKSSYRYHVLDELPSAQQQQKQTPQIQQYVQHHQSQQIRVPFPPVRLEDGLFPIRFQPTPRTTAVHLSMPLIYHVPSLDTITVQQTNTGDEKQQLTTPRLTESNEVRGRPGNVKQAPRSKKPSINFVRRLLLALHQQ